MTSQTHARIRPTHVPAITSSLPWVRLAGAAAIAVGGLVALVLVRLTGGSPNPLNHLGYLPIVLAAYLFGWRGGLLTAGYVAFLLGPLPTLASLAGVSRSLTPGPSARPPSRSWVA